MTGQTTELADSDVPHRFDEGFVRLLVQEVDGECDFTVKRYRDDTAIVLLRESGAQPSLIGNRVPSVCFNLCQDLIPFFGRLGHINRLADRRDTKDSESDI